MPPAVSLTGKSNKEVEVLTGISAVGQAQAGGPAGAAGRPPALSALTLKEQFLQLLIAELRNQDPMRPMEDRDFITQLAQFAVLEQLESLDQQFRQAAVSGQVGTAGALLGRMVEADDGTGAAVTGPVSAVLVDPERGVSLKIGDKTVPLVAVRKILS